MSRLSTADKLKLKKQMEFYFSDSNLPYDRFMKKQIQDSEGGWVDLSLLLVFSRIRAILKLDVLEPEDIDSHIIQEVAKALESSDLLEVGQEGYVVRRKNMPEDLDEVKDKVDQRTLQVCPFSFRTTMEDIAKVFSSYGTVQQVRLLRFERCKRFSGRALVEMSTQAEADAAMAAQIKHDGVELRKQSKVAYMREHEEAGKDEATAAFVRDRIAIVRPLVTSEGLPADVQEPEGKRPRVEAPQAAATDDAPCADVAQLPVEKTPAFTHGLLVKATPVDKDTDLKDARELRTLFGGSNRSVEFVEMHREERFLILRCQSPDAATSLLTKCDENMILRTSNEDGVETCWSLEQMSGDEEVAFWERKRTSDAQRQRVEHSGGNNYRERGRQQRGRGRGRGRSRGRGRH